MGIRPSLRKKKKSVLLSDPKATTVADDIADTLADALFYFCGEQLRPDQDFILDSQAMKLIQNIYSNPEASPAFLALMIYTEDPDRQLLNKSSRVS